MTSAIRPAVDARISISSSPCLQSSVSAVASCLWDPESEIHYEDFTFSDIMETEERDREEDDVLAFVPRSEEREL